MTKNIDIKRLYRSKKDQKFLGVLAGLGDYLGQDPVVLRIVFVLVTAFTGFVPGIVAYLLMALVMPETQ